LGGLSAKKSPSKVLAESIGFVKRVKTSYYAPCSSLDGQTLFSNLPPTVLEKHIFISAYKVVHQKAKDYLKIIARIESEYYSKP
jgi:hypothetical protein